MKIDHTHCCYCRRRFVSDDLFLARTKEHFMPISRTGKDNENVLQACRECNGWKASMLPEDFLRLVEKYYNKKRRKGTYQLRDYAQIIGSLKHWVKYFKGKTISDYKYIP